MGNNSEDEKNLLFWDIITEMLYDDDFLNEMMNSPPEDRPRVASKRFGEISDDQLILTLKTGISYPNIKSLYETLFTDDFAGSKGYRKKRNRS
jgi:hypothetical protein